MRKAILAAVFTFVSQPVFAGMNDATWYPPARYDHPYTGEMILKQVPPADVKRQCLLIGIRSSTDRPRGCANTIRGKCHVVTIDRPFYGTTPEYVLIHERGHCNGWHASHPD